MKKLFLLIAFTLFSACAHQNTSRLEESLHGQWEPLDQPITYEVERRSLDYTPNLQIVNVLGNVEIQASDDDKIHLFVVPKEGLGPRYLQLDHVSGWDRLFVLDEEGIVNDPAPETPTLTHDGRIFRLHTRLPRCDVIACVPKGTNIDVRACAKLSVEGSASIIARTSSGAHVKSGEGSLRLSVADGPLLVENAFYDVEANIAGHAEFRGSIGDKSIRGQGNVIVRGGRGLLNINVTGDVWAETSLSPGYARSTSVGVSNHDGDLAPVGPSSPNINPEQKRREASMSANVIEANEIELRLPAATSLDISINAMSGVVALDIPESVRAVVHERSPSSVKLTLNKADGELYIKALTNAELIVLQP